MKITIKLQPTFSIKWPNIRIVINNNILHDGPCEVKNNDLFVFNTNVNPRDKNNLYIEHYGKQGYETIVDEDGVVVSDRAVMLKSISLDDFEIPELILYNKPFVVEWSKEQLEENPTRPKTITNNLYFGYNGSYCYTFGNDSAKEYYLCLLEKERIANIHNKKEMIGPDGNTIEVFEFSGNLIDSHKPQDYTIGQLFKLVKNGN